jgi:hypothetical protein
MDNARLSVSADIPSGTAAQKRSIAMAIRYHNLLVPALALALAACGGGEKDKQTADGDPALTGALSDQIMVDPDLAGQNKGGAALGGGGPASVELPAEQRSPEAIAAAKSDAAKLVGGTLQKAPTASTGGDAAQGPVSLADVAGNTGAQCAGKVDYSAAWAAKMPSAFPIYPRGHVAEAAGTDKDGCRLRVVSFVTPVGLDDVLDFYFTRAGAAGFDAEHRTEGTDHVLGGSKDTSAYVVYVRKSANGLTEVDLVTNGG